MSAGTLTTHCRLTAGATLGSNLYVISFSANVTAYFVRNTGGAFLATDFVEFAYVGSSSNIRKRFQDLSFLDKKDKSTIEVLWIECDRFTAISKIEQQLLTYLHHITFLQHPSQS